MHRCRTRRAGRIRAALAVTLAAAVAVGLTATSGAGAAPPDPLRRTAAAAHAVTALQQQVAAQTAQLDAATAALDTAQQHYNAALARRDRAQQSLRTARAHQRAAQRQYRRAQADLVSVAVSNYQNADGYGSFDVTSVTTLLTSSDPGTLLNTAVTQQQVDAYQTNVVDSVQQALAARSRAVRQQRAALREITTQTARMHRLQQAAARSLLDSESALQSLRSALIQARATKRQAEKLLSQFLGGWSVADPHRAAQLNSEYARLAAQVGAPIVPSTGHWSAAVGASAAWRALQMIGTPYAWDGGNAAGATRGVCAAGAAANDCHVVGFDCSGLALYGWAPYLSLPHFAADQYRSGRVHPAVAALRPGDLVFWSSNATAAGIHHVAVYVGEGNVVQAPQSGDIVRVTPLARVDAGYFGATRPLS